ncbi:MAG: hypothetical protein U9Q29_09705 [Campylobacterota bacterium]|nr:hypothetical protein [Campylobacterota bacterium]
MEIKTLNIIEGSLPKRA